MTKVLMKVCAPMRKRRPIRRHLDCVCLEVTTTRTEFRRSLAEKLGELELFLRGGNAKEQQWTSITAALHEAAAQTIGYKSKNHQDWF